jgi:predicted transcriptional regulator
MDENTGTPDLTAVTAEVVSAYVAKNALRPTDIPDLIASVHRALQGLSAPPQAEPEKREPPVSIRKSITPDFLISLEDGRRYKTLRRHLAGRGLTPGAVSRGARPQELTLRGIGDRMPVFAIT